MWLASPVRCSFVVKYVFRSFTIMCSRIPCPIWYRTMSTKPTAFHTAMSTDFLHCRIYRVKPQSRYTNAFHFNGVKLHGIDVTLDFMVYKRTVWRWHTTGHCLKLILVVTRNCHPFCFFSSSRLSRYNCFILTSSINFTCNKFSIILLENYYLAILNDVLTFDVSCWSSVYCNVCSSPGVQTQFQNLSGYSQPVLAISLSGDSNTFVVECCRRDIVIDTNVWSNYLALSESFMSDLPVVMARM